MKKSILCLLMILSIACVSGCGSDNKSGNENAASGQNAAENNKDESAGSETIEVEEYDVEKIVTLAEYKGIEVETAVSEKEIEDEINKIVEENPLYEEVKDREVKEGDTVNIDYEGKKDGVAFDGGTAAGFDLVIGSGSFIDGFEEGLIGTKPGEVKDLNLKFPEEYQNSPDLAGQEVVFTVTINYIKGEPIETVFNDEFVERVSYGEYSTTDDYRDYIKDKLYSNKVSSMVDTAFMQVIEASSVSEVPQGLVEIMKQRIDASYRLMAEQNGATNFEEFITQFSQLTMDEYNKRLDETAKTYVEQQLITEAIAKKENITVTDEEYQQYLDQYLETNQIESMEELEKSTLENYKTDIKTLINESIMLDKVFAVIGENIVEIDEEVKE